MKLSYRTSRPDREQSVMPLVNVVFLLLIFFMLAGQLTVPEIFRIEPPVSDSRTPGGADQSLILLSSGGELGVDGKRVTAAELRDIVGEWLTADPATVVKLKADAKVDSHRVIEISELLREEGVGSLLLLTTVPRA